MEHDLDYVVTYSRIPKQNLLIVMERAEFRSSRVQEEVSFWKNKQCGMASRTLTSMGRADTGW